MALEHFRTCRKLTQSACSKTGPAVSLGLQETILHNFLALLSTLLLPPAGAECFAAELPPRHRQALAVPVQTDQGRVRNGPKVTIVAL